MPKLSDVKASITDLDDQEAFDLIKHLRFLRRQVPEKKARKKSTSLKKSAPKKKLSKEEILNKMTPEQKEELRKYLEELDG